MNWIKQKENEFVITKSETKVCASCFKRFPADLKHFGRGTIRNREGGIKVIYLRGHCRKCFIPKTKPTKEQYQKHSFHYYQRNRDAVNIKKRKLRITKNIDKHIKNIIEVKKWKNIFNTCIKGIERV